MDFQKVASYREDAAQQSEPFTSETDSIYSHLRSNYLESDQSIAVDMRLDRESYHMKPIKDGNAFDAACNA